LAGDHFDRPAAILTGFDRSVELYHSLLYHIPAVHLLVLTPRRRKRVESSQVMAEVTSRCYCICIYISAAVAHSLGTPIHLQCSAVSPSGTAAASGGGSE